MTPSVKACKGARQVKARERLRGTTWTNIRVRILRRDPLCVHCRAKGITTATAEIDHKVPLHLGGSDADENLQGLCVECHQAKTAEELGHEPRTKFADGRVVR